MSEVNNAFLLNELQDQFSANILSVEEPYGLLTIEVSKDINLALVTFLNKHPQIQMQFLTDVCGMHHPDLKGKELAVVYHLHSLVNNLRLRVKCHMSIDAPQINSITSIYSAANWQERETYDFFGIEFIGHPNLKRILNVEEMDYFPMRKEFPLEDPTRTDKNDNYFGR